MSAHCAARSFLESLFRFVEKNRTKKTLKRLDARAQNLLCIVFHPFVFCDAKSCHLTENLVVCELLKVENKVWIIWRQIEIYSILGENPGRFVNSCEESESALNLKHQPGGSQANQPGESKEYIIQEKVNSQRTKYSDSDDIFVCGWKKVRFIVCSFNLHFDIENIISAQIHRQCLTFFGWYQSKNLDAGVRLYNIYTKCIWLWMQSWQQKHIVRKEQLGKRNKKWWYIRQPVISRNEKHDAKRQIAGQVYSK